MNSSIGNKAETPVFEALEPVLQSYVGTPGSLISILQKAQDIYGYLSKPLLNHIAKRSGQPPAKVFGVATFYAQFRLKPVGRHMILLCQGTACHVNGSAGIEEAVREVLGTEEGETTPDGLFTYTNVACLGCCSLSPAMMVDGRAFGSLTPAKVRDIIEDIRRKEGGV